jgi:hypothetical protein
LKFSDKTCVCISYIRHTSCVIATLHTSWLHPPNNIRDSHITNRYRGLFPGGTQWPVRDAGRSPPSTTQVNKWGNPNWSVRFHGLIHKYRYNFTFYFESVMWSV